jgi:2-amino-4-hydroxy-6-hydroxymethyldihydropteridine pyrophosphokinase
MERVFLLLGSNLEDRQQNLSHACDKLIHRGYPLIQRSSIYTTQAWGIQNQPSFLNQVIEIQCDDSPEILLNVIQQIELEIGRVRDQKWGPRLIDIDILYFGNKKITQENLIIPHPEISNRRFALVPLYEIAPNFIHPVLKKMTIELLNECDDSLDVNLFTS